MKILIIPESFPTDFNPVAGIFMKDQIMALSPFADVSIFNSNLWYRGVYEQTGDARFYDFHLFNRKPPGIIKSFAYKWWERQSLKMALRMPKHDIIHLHGAALRGTWATALARIWDVPLVITEHTGPWSSISSRPAVFARAKKVLEQAQCVLPVSRHLKKEIVESGISPKRMEVLGNPVNTDLFTLRKLPLNANKMILFVGRLDPFKGAFRTLKAYHAAMANLMGYKLCIAGTGSEESAVREYIRENSLESTVEFISEQLTRTEMRDLFHQASFLVFPSEFESFGLVAAEAMATGLPVVITNRTGPLDYSNDQNAVSVEPENVEAITSGIIKLGKTIKEYEPSKIRQGIMENFAIQSYGQKVYALLKHIRDV